MNSPVRLSISQTFFTMFLSCRNEISGVITIDKSDVHAKGHKRSKQILSQSGHFQTVTPVWILRWLQNDAQRLEWHGRSALLFLPEASFGVIDLDLQGQIKPDNKNLPHFELGDVIKSPPIESKNHQIRTKDAKRIFMIPIDFGVD